MRTLRATAWSARAQPSWPGSCSTRRRPSTFASALLLAIHLPRSARCAGPSPSLICCHMVCSLKQAETPSTAAPVTPRLVVWRHSCHIARRHRRISSCAGTAFWRAPCTRDSRIATWGIYAYYYAAAVVGCKQGYKSRASIAKAAMLAGSCPNQASGAMIGEAQYPVKCVKVQLQQLLALLQLQLHLQVCSCTPTAVQISNRFFPGSD